jgi:dihydroneopterin aldolase
VAGDAIRLDAIRILGLKVFAHHGVLPEERQSGQPFLIDLELRLDLAAAGHSDDVGDTVDYGNLAGRVHQLVKGQDLNLIESVATRVAGLVLEDPRVSEVTVTVHKPEAPIPFEFSDVSVAVTRRRRA